jgi:hypothetical protein
MAVSGGNVGIGTTNPQAKLEVNGAIKMGNTAAACDGTQSGSVKYNGTKLQFCDGTSWRDIVLQTAGTTAPVTSMGPPVSASVYSFASATANYTPGFGAVANTWDGTWLASGTTTYANGSCVSLPGDNVQTIVYDLGSVRSIGNVYTSTDPGVAPLAIAFSVDGVTYSQATTSTWGNTGGVVYEQLVLSQTVSARYIRVMTATNSASNSAYATFCDIAVGP